MKIGLYVDGLNQTFKPETNDAVTHHDSKSNPKNN